MGVPTDLPDATHARLPEAVDAADVPHAEREDRRRADGRGDRFPDPSHVAGHARRRVRSRRSATARALALAALVGAASTSARADSPFERVGVGAGFAMPTPGLSLFTRRDDRWSGTATLGVGAELRINREREGSRGGYWTGGVAWLPGALGLVRGGYGRAWQRGPWRWHLEATLNLPVYIDDGGGDDAYVSLGNVALAAYSLLIPIGFGVHYTFD